MSHAEGRARLTASSQDDPEKPPVQETAPSNGQKPKKKEETSPPKEAQKESPPGARLEGKLTGSDRKTPLPGARLHAVSKDGKVFSSAPADARGRYTLPGVPPGAYQLAISTDDGVFILESEVGIASSNAFSLDLATVPAEAATGRVPGIDLEARGFATIVQGKRKEGGRSFWGGPKGIVLLAVSAGAVALILSNSDDPGEDSVSPSLP
ncbi:MAG TPA: carboxypeptidase-like regulatory domain-containing protein [Candidatus Polarisedimenticolia bacterium]|nr:carboxypeptidase-like regulatory domain-containing protein [Candidatus Polarisedimenticolia bacterium]